MHFYPFNIGDYATATAHLEPLEDIAYRRLMDLYYSTEKPIPLDIEKVARLIRMRTHSDCIAIILEEFFTLENDGHHCKRIDVELFKFQEKSCKARDSAKARWSKAKENQQLNGECNGNANALNAQCDGNAKQELRNKKQDIRNNIKEDPRFAEFWDLYAKKSDQKKCKAKWSKLKEADINKIMSVVSDYVKSTPDKSYRKNPITWLNGECWNDEIQTQFSYGKPSINNFTAPTEGQGGVYDL